MAILTNPKLIAAWPFNGTFQSQYGYGGTLELQQAGSSNVPILKGGPFGNFARFNGSDQFLSIASANVGALDRGGSNVSVFVWICREEFDSPGFLLGRWDEGTADRQYGPFIDLPTYGGANQVCSHVSYTGDATPGYPYSIEYAANVTVIAEYDKWVLVGMTYDGSEVISWYENVFEPRPTYTDNLSATYSKNPFLHAAGLNPSSNSDFTMGAVNMSGGPGNYFAGRMAMPMVFNDTLTQAEIDEIKDLAPSEATYFITPLTDSVQNVSDYGMSSVYGTTAVDSSSNATLKNWCVYSSTANSYSYVYVHGGDFDYSATPSFVYKESLDIANFASFKATLNNSDLTDSVKLCIKVGGAWYASVADYAVTTTGSGTDWTNAEEKEFLANDQVLPLTVTTGVELTLGSTPQSLPAGNIEGYGVYAGSVAGIVRVDTLRIYVSGQDLAPDQFTFVDVTDATQSTEYISNAITVQGVDTGQDIDISITGGEYRVDTGGGFGAWTSAASTVQLNYQVEVRVTSSASANTAVSTTLSIGGVTDTYTVTTAAAASSFSTDSVTSGLIAHGAQFTINFSNAQGAVSITDFGGAGALTIDSQDANSLTATMPELTAFGDRSLRYQQTITVTVSDGSTTATIDLAGADVLASEEYGAITELNVVGVYYDDSQQAGGPQVGDQVFAIVTNGFFDVTTGIVGGDQNTVIQYKVAATGEVWPATFATVTIDPAPDTTAPVITLQGNNPLTLVVGTAYSEPGYTATDDTDGDVTGNVVVTGSVDHNTIGQYTLNYNVSDTAGNNAIQVTRTINVVASADTTPDQFSLGADVVDAALNQIITRNFTVSGINTLTTFTATGVAEVSSDGVNFFSSVQLNNSETLHFRIQASGSLNTAVVGGVSAGSVTDSVTVTTTATSSPQIVDVGGDNSLYPGETANLNIVNIDINTIDQAVLFNGSAEYELQITGTAVTIPSFVPPGTYTLILRTFA